MKRTLVLLLLVCPCVGFSQNATIPLAFTKENFYQTMIDSAITLRLVLCKQDIEKGNINIGEYYLLDEKYRYYYYSKRGVTFKTIDIYSPKNKKLLKKGIWCWGIRPFLINNVMVIFLVDLSISYKNNMYNFSQGSGSRTTFEYNCDQQKWVLASNISLPL